MIIINCFIGGIYVICCEFFVECVFCYVIDGECVDVMCGFVFDSDVYVVGLNG